MLSVRVAVYIACCFALLLSADLKAQEDRPVTFYTGVGGAFTFGSLGHYSDIGYLGMAGIGLKPSPLTAPELEIVGRFQYIRFPAGNSDSVDFEYLIGGIDLKLNRLFAQQPNTFMIVGGGASRTKHNLAEYSPYATLAVGLESGLLVLEARLLMVFGNEIKTSSFLPVTLGLRF